MGSKQWDDRYYLTLDQNTLAVQQPVILFDGVCNLCNASVNFVIDRDHDSLFKLAALQSGPGEELLQKYQLSSDYLESIVLIDDHGVWRNSTAALRIARRLSGAWRLMYAFIIVPRPLRDAVYGWIARNRYKWFGKKDSCRLPTPDIATRFL